VAVGVLILVALVGITILRQGPKATPLPGQPLKQLGHARGIVVGTAVRADVLKSTRAYRELVAQQFASLTPENEMKWEVTEPDQGDFHFGPGDEIVDAAKGAGQQVRGHTLIWHVQYPGWLKDLGPKRLAAATKKHIAEVVGHYRDSGVVKVWDVVNEVVADDGALRPSIFLNRLGPGFIAGAFDAAHAADPKAKLYINEIGAESIGPKSNRLYEVVRGLRSANVPIDGVGFQVHSNLRGLPSDFVANMQRFKALGLDVAITEADVGLKLPPSEADLRAQAKIYAEIVRACEAVKCASLTFWGFSDSQSWISETQAGMGAATMLDDRFAPKPAFGAIQDALRR
jgi:endo-1,4-beta-xylanase